MPVAHAWHVFIATHGARSKQREATVIALRRQTPCEGYYEVMGCAYRPSAVSVVANGVPPGQGARALVQFDNHYQT